MSEYEKYDRIPEWKLERYLLGELEPEEMEVVRRKIEKDPALRHRLEALRESDREILERYPARMMEERIRRKSSQPGVSGASLRRVFGSRFWPVPAIPALAVLLLIAILPTFFPPDVQQTGDPAMRWETRLKGEGARLLLYRKTESGSERLDNGTTAREGDLILVQYHAAAREYGAIVSVDGRGTITRHFPREGSHAGTLEKEGPVSLSFAYELDDAPRWELFYFITSNSPFDVEMVIGAIRKATVNVTGFAPGTLDLPDRFEHYLFTLRKEANDGV